MMTRSDIWKIFTAVVAVCGVAALFGLRQFATDPESAAPTLEKTMLPARAIVAPDAAGSDVGFANHILSNADSDRALRPDPSTQLTRDDSTDPGVTARDAVVRRTQEHGDSFDRFEAIITLGESLEATAELALIHLLYDHDPEIREAAVESLGLLGTPGATQGLGYALTDANQLVRRTAVELLAEIGRGDALAALAITLNDPDIELRLAAVYELADNESVPAAALLQRFLSDTDPLVRNTAAEFLND